MRWIILTHGNQVRLALGVLALALGASSGASAFLTQTFVSSLPVAQLVWDDGLGIFDPEDPANDCAAVTGARSLTGAFLYHQQARLYLNGARNETSGGGLTVDGVGTPVDDCFGLSSQGNDVGSSAFEGSSGFTIQLDVTVFPTGVPVLATGNWTLTRCEMAPGMTLAGVLDTGDGEPATTTRQGTGAPGEFVGLTVDCTGESFPFPDLVTEAGLGFAATGFETAWVHDVVPVGSGSSVVESCFASAILDMATGLVTAGSDEDWFAVLDVAQPEGWQRASAWNFRVGASNDFDHVAGLFADAGSCAALMQAP